jgi:hypothetical protein
MTVATLAAPARTNGSWSAPWTARARTPLIALTVALVALDAIGLGLRWADASNNAISEVTPHVLQPHVSAPDAVVAGSDNLTSSGSSASGYSSSGSGSRGATTGSGALIGPVAPPVAQPTPNTPTKNPATPAPAPTPAVPLAQVDLAVPGVAQVSVGAGDNSCTTIDLTLIALGNCPVPSGDGPVILHVGGSLVGH